MRRQPWEREPGETDKAWRAFQAFRDAGPDRSLVGTYRAVYGRPEAEKVRPFFRTWSSRHSWDDRVEAWDRHVDRAVQHEFLDQHRAMAVRHVAVARLMQAKALEALQAMDPSKLTARDIRDWMEAAQKLARGLRIAIREVGG